MQQPTLQTNKTGLIKMSPGEIIAFIIIISLAVLAIVIINIVFLPWPDNIVMSVIPVIIAVISIGSLPSN